MSGGFSGVVRLSNVNDYIAPSQVYGREGYGRRDTVLERVRMFYRESCLFYLIISVA